MRPILPILGIISAIYIFGGSWLLSNLICGSGATPAAFSVSDGNFKTSSDQMFSFPQSSDKVSYTSDTKKSFTAIGKYLNDNPNRQLNLSGIFASKEKNNSSFENLGLARAEAVKSLLVSLGGNTDNIATASQQVDNLSFMDKKLYGGVNFLFEEKQASAEAIGDASGSDSSLDGGSGVGTGALTLMFEESQVDYEPTADLNEHMNYLKTYLESNPGATIIVTGHTDNQGTLEAKMKIAESRARKVRRILRNNGFASKQVEWRADGPNNPVASNESSDGIAQNNRVIISIEK